MEEDYEEDLNEFVENREVQSVELVQCEICNRKFHPARVERHQVACEKAQMKQKEREKLIKKKQKQLVEKKHESEQNDKTVKNWREEHKQFQELIQYNRKIKDMESKGEDISQIKKPETVVNPTYVYCEYCERRFDPDVGAKHIPKCKEIKAKPKPPRKNTEQDKPKRTTQISTPSTSGNSQQERGSIVKKQHSDSSQQFRPSSLQKMMKTTDQLKQSKGLPEIKNANWTNIGFVDCQNRATAIQDTECPHCNRKFTSRAAERHLPICEKLTRKQMFQNKYTNRKSIPLKKNGYMAPILPQILKSTQMSVIDGNSVCNLKFCTQCGSKFLQNHKYCGGCGHKRDGEHLI